MWDEFNQATPNPWSWIGTVSGHQKEGKTDFSLSAPGPIAIHSFDEGVSGPAERYFKEGKRIRVAHYAKITPGSNDAAQVAKQVWAEFRKDFNEALATPEIRTIIIDSHTEQWQAQRLAEFGRVDKVMPQRYSVVNSELKGIISDIRRANKIGIMIMRLKKQYVGNDWMGGYEPGGFGEMEFESDINLHAWRASDDKKFYATVKSTRFNPMLQGFIFGQEGYPRDIKTLMGWMFQDNGVPMDFNHVNWNG